MFNFLDFETIGSCNRRCPTCIRNSHPDRDAVASWFGKNYLPEELIFDAIKQAIAMGYRGRVCLSHYNEPTMDERLPAIAHKVRSYSELETVHINTNGDFMTPELAAELDGALDYIKVTLYMKDPMLSERAAWLPTLFQETEVMVVKATERPHMPTHFSPVYNLDVLLPVARSGVCLPRRVIINHRRQYLLCCSDVVGNFGLGTFPEISIKDHWYGKRQNIAKDLAQSGGRSLHPYCMGCPSTAHWSTENGKGVVTPLENVRVGSLTV